jgi:hypothetical protein
MFFLFYFGRMMLSISSSVSVSLLRPRIRFPGEKRLRTLVDVRYYHKRKITSRSLDSYPMKRVTTILGVLSSLSLSLSLSLSTRYSLTVTSIKLICTTVHSTQCPPYTAGHVTPYSTVLCSTLKYTMVHHTVQSDA